MSKAKRVCGLVRMRRFRFSTGGQLQELSIDTQAKVFAGGDVLLPVSLDDAKDCCVRYGDDVCPVKRVLRC